MSHMKSKHFSPLKHFFFLKIILFSFLKNVEKHCPKSLAEITLICIIFEANVCQVSTALY